MMVVKEVKLIFSLGYKNRLVPGRIVGQNQIPPNLSIAYTTVVALCQELSGWLIWKNQLDPKQVFNFVGYQIDLKEGTVTPTLEFLQFFQNSETALQTDLPGQIFDVPDRVINSHLETSPPRSTAYQTDIVALEKHLEGTKFT